MSQPANTPANTPTRSVPHGSVNGLGIAGFVTSIIAICTGGLLSPIALLLSVIALFRRPRGFAVAGTVVGGFGTVLLVALIISVYMIAISANIAIHQVVGFLETMFVLDRASAKIERYYEEHGRLPDDGEGTELIDGIEDGWGTQLRYKKLDEDRYRFVSAGPDGEFDTDNDIRLPIHHPR